MPFFLLVPPASNYSENLESQLSSAERAVTFQNELLQELSVSNLKKTLPSGAFRKTKIYEWTAPFDALLFTALIFPEQRDQGMPFLQLAALIRLSDCKFLGAVWKPVEGNSWKLPPGFERKPVPLSQILTRQFRPTTRFQLDVNFEGKFSDRANILSGFMVGEVLASQGVSLSTPASRLFCVAHEGILERKPTANAVVQPAKPHRSLRLTFKPQRSAAQNQLPNAPTEWSLPLVSGKAEIVTVPFGEKIKENLLFEKSFVFDPVSIGEQLIPFLKPHTHLLTEESFRVVKRFGRWIYLDRGRAYGLEIGMHLTGPRGAKLHIIHFATGEGIEDGAIAMVRKEEASAPIKIGEVITFDNTIYPK
jgi:hypothetical protein